MMSNAKGGCDPPGREQKVAVEVGEVVWVVNDITGLNRPGGGERVDVVGPISSGGEAVDWVLCAETTRNGIRRSNLRTGGGEEDGMKYS